MSTTSFAAYPSAYSGLRRKVRYTATKLVVTEMVLGMMFAVSKASNIK